MIFRRSRKNTPAATVDGSVPQYESVGAGEPAPAEGEESEGREGVGEARVEVVDVGETDRETLAEQVADADDDRDEEPLAETAGPQRAEREGQRREAQHDDVHRVEPAAPV